MITYDQEALQDLLAGAEVVYRFVKTTLGPQGRNVIVGNIVTHDGVTAARSIHLKDKRSTGVELLKQAAEKNDIVGDGTTTVTVLAYHIMNEANKLIVAGHSAMDLSKELQALEPIIIDKLTKLSEPVINIADIATISAGDATMGKVIADVINEIGKDGIVTVEEIATNELTSEVVDGFSVPRGYASPLMVNEKKRQESVYKTAPILVIEDKINTFSELLPILEKLANSGKREIVIFTGETGPDVLVNINLNNQHGQFKTLLITLPDYFDYILRDIAGVTEATIVGSNSGELLSTCDLDVIGTANKVIAGKDTTSIIGTANTNLDDYILTLDKKDPNYDKRVANIRGKVAIIKVGGSTEVEIQEKKFRVDDAVAATKAALQDGIIAGGGNALLMISKELSDTLAGKVLSKALEQPFRILLENAGINPDKWIDQITSNVGINLKNPNGLVNLKEAGIIDPVLVTKSAITNAISIATIVITAGAVNTGDDDEDK